MKKIRMLFSLCFLIILIPMLTSCSVKPHLYKWDVEYIQANITYLNGNTTESTIYKGINPHNLYGISSEECKIEFYEDKTMMFKPYKEETLTGTYKCKDTFSDTTIYIDLSNNEKIEAYAKSYYFGTELMFTYKDVSYLFAFDETNHVSEEEYINQYNYLGAELRDWQEYRPYNVESCYVFCSSDKSILTYEGKVINLFDDNVYVDALRVDENNQVTFLNKLEQGNCYSRIISYQDSYFITIVYYDPLKEETEEKFNGYYKLTELMPEIIDFYHSSSTVNIKYSNEIYNVTNVNYHIYNDITDQVEINKILDQLLDLNVYPCNMPTTEELGKTHIKETLTIIDTAGKLEEIIIYTLVDKIKIGVNWYSFNYKFPEVTYVGAYQKMACHKYETDVYKNSEYLGSIKIMNEIEFIVDPKNDYSYSFSHDTRRLVGQMGEITIYDATHFRYKGQYYLVVGEKDFSKLFELFLP